jgi:hypothetical protein
MKEKPIPYISNDKFSQEDIFDCWAGRLSGHPLHRPFFSSVPRFASCPALLYIDISVRPSCEPLFFFGHLFVRFTLPQAPRVRQTTPTAVSSSIDLSDAFDALEVSRFGAPLHRRLCTVVL